MKIVYVEEFIRHEDYVDSYLTDYDNDICILKLATPLTFTKYDDAYLIVMK